jgi:AhpC/TSA family protein/cytochrome c biogenesis DsbD-like protein
VELQANLPTLEANGIIPFALSYDSQETLAAFSAARGITYPLLSDAGSAFITALGILNTTVEPANEHYGIPYPGTYFIGTDGRVVDKVFHAGHRTRNAAPTSLREHFGLPVGGNGPHDRQERGEIIAVASLDTGTFVRGERIGMRVTIQTAPGVHIYGQPLPGGYIPTTLEIHAPETVAVEPVRYPPPHILRTDWLNEDLPVYDGTITLTTALTFTEQREDVTITATLRYQACTTGECFLPERLTFTLPMTFQPFT